VTLSDEYKTLNFGVTTNNTNTLFFYCWNIQSPMHLSSFSIQVHGTWQVSTKCLYRFIKTL